MTIARVFLLGCSRYFSAEKKIPKCTFCTFGSIDRSVELELWVGSDRSHLVSFFLPWSKVFSQIIEIDNIGSLID